MTANELYEEGNRLRRAGNFKGAMQCYLRATKLDPDGPASTALEMMRRIYAFRHTDLYNP